MVLFVGSKCVICRLKAGRAVAEGTLSWVHLPWGGVLKASEKYFQFLAKTGSDFWRPLQHLLKALLGLNIVLLGARFLRYAIAQSSKGVGKLNKQVCAPHISVPCIYFHVPRDGVISHLGLDLGQTFAWKGWQPVVEFILWVREGTECPPEILFISAVILQYSVSCRRTLSHWASFRLGPQFSLGWAVRMSKSPTFLPLHRDGPSVKPGCTCLSGGERTCKSHQKGERGGLLSDSHPQESLRGDFSLADRHLDLWYNSCWDVH